MLIFAPTRIRYTVLALLCFLAMITYIDRAVIGSAKADVMSAVGHPPEDFFWLLVAFQLAYALCEVPTGWMGDVFGPRKTLLRIVLWWTAFIALTGLAGLTFGTEVVFIGFGTLIVVQFLFGAGEAGAFPNITRAVYNWFPATSRGFAQGAVWMSARFMGGLTPLVWLALTEFAGLNWREVFFVFAGVAVLWCVVFVLWFRNRPDDHPWANTAECELARVGKSDAEGGHASVPWGKLFRSPNLWMVCGMYFCGNYGWYFFMYFLPGFMKENFGAGATGDMAKVQLALLTGGPLLLGMAGCYLGGLLTDYFVRRSGRKWGRRVCGVVGFGLASASYLAAVAGASTGNVWLFAGFIALAGFFNDLTMATSWATCQDIGRRYAAIVAGSMNMIGNLGGTLTNFVTGMIVKHHQPEPGMPPDAAGQDRLMQGYMICLTLYAVAFALGAVFWLRIDASKPLVGDQPEA
jgi:MFS transporter, ACS family, glucarate transporter